MQKVKIFCSRKEKEFQNIKSDYCLPMQKKSLTKVKKFLNEGSWSDAMEKNMQKKTGGGVSTRRVGFPIVGGGCQVASPAAVKKRHGNPENRKFGGGTFPGLGIKKKKNN